MNITFLSDLRNMTDEQFLEKILQTVEWKPNEKLSKNPKLLKTLRNISYPSLRKYKYMFPPENESENQDFI